MRKLLFISYTILLFFTTAGCMKMQPEQAAVSAQRDNSVIRVSTTTSVNDSGLLSYLQPIFEADTGYRLEITSAGTGAAIEKGRRGDADVLLVHAKEAEEAFIEEGYSEKRLPFMYNYFVIIGPVNDPVSIKGLTSAADAFKRIAHTKGVVFVSRGDNSGTNQAEIAIWKAAGVDPEGQDYFISTGQGMGASINIATEQQAYILTDKATYLSHAMRDNLAILLEESEELKNTYAMIAISTERWSDANEDGAQAFIDWVLSEEAQGLISQFGREDYGEILFFIDK